MSAWDMYWLLRLDGIRTVLEPFCVAGVVIAIVLLIIYVFARVTYKMQQDEEALKCSKALRFPTICVNTVASLLVILYVALPTTKQMAAIIVVPKIVNNEQVQEIPENLIELCNEWTKDKIKEIKGTGK